MTSEDNKRDTQRLEILGDLRGEVMVFQPMAIKEISRGGAQVETGFPLHLDSLHDFRLTLGDRSLVSAIGDFIDAVTTGRRSP